jgi:RHS repeat-associated protein
MPHCRVRRVSLRALLPIMALAVIAHEAEGFQPSPTSPYTYSIGPSDQHAHDKVGDGFYHDSGCTPGGAPDYFCGCGVGTPGNLKPPKLTMNGTTLEVEYWIRNAYCVTADASNPNRPFAQSHYIHLNSIGQNDSVSGTFSIVAPYWEHGKVSIANLNTCNRYQAVLQISYLVGGQVHFEFASSEIAGPTGQEPSGRSCLDDDRSCPVPVAAGEPINVGSGNMRYDETLFSIAENVDPLVLGISYNSRNLTAGPLGTGFTHSFSETMKPLGGNPNRIQWINGRGEKTIFYSGNPGTVDFVAVWPADAVGTVSLVSGIYTFKDLGRRLVKFGSTAGEWQSTEDRWGNRVSGTYTSGKLTSITDPENRVWSLVNDPTSGKLTSITDPESRIWTFGYDANGRLQFIRDPLHPSGNPWRQFSYVTGNASEPPVLAQVQDDALAVLEAHEYDTAGRAISSWSGDTVVTAGVPHPGANARSLVTLVYNSATQTTVTTKVDATINSVSSFTLAAPAGRFLPLTISGTCPSCGAESDLQTFTYDEFNRTLTKTVGIAPENVQTAYLYNLDGMITSRTEAVGKPEARITTYAYGKADWPSFVTQMQEPSVANPPSALKITTFAWGVGACAGFSGETCLETKVVGFTSPTLFETHTTTTKFSANPTHRVTSIAGPNSGQLISMTYYNDTDATINRRGRLSASILQTSTTPTSLMTAFDDYDLFGTARKTTDPNSVETTRTTDGRGRVTSVVSKKPPLDSGEPADYTTGYTYDGRDRLIEIIPPRMNMVPPAGGKTRFQYEDGSNRLTDTLRVDSSGNQRERLHLTLNVIGGRTKEEAQICTSPANPCLPGNWLTKRSDDFTYEAHNRLSGIVHPVGGSVAYAYDTRGNLTGVKDERHASSNTIYSYDSLNRLIEVRQKRTIVPGTDVVTGYLHDKLDNLKQVTDPKGNVTSYEYDDFGQTRKQTSPVTGATAYSYDAAGNLTSSTDANSAVTTRTYDVANRLLTATSTRSGFSTEVVTYSYDAVEPSDEIHPPSPPTPHPKRYGKGRLTSMTDPSGSSQFAYERRGLLKKDWKTIDSNTYGVQFGYDANGNRTGIRYPSGRLVTYGFDFGDRPASAASTGATFVSSALYEPFGPVSQIDYGNGTSKTMTFDQRYRPTTNKLMKSPTTISQQTFAPDGVGNFMSITDNVDANYNRTTLSYDDLNRLTTANSGTSLWGTGSYTYDDLGSVTNLTMGTRTAAFSYSGTTPKLTSVNESGIGVRAVTYDSAGNETALGPSTFSYSARNFLSAADNLTYAYDGRGLRVTTALSSTVFPISLTINPVSVVKGSPATGTVTLNSGAPVGGAAVTLKSSDTAAATVPPSVIVPQNLTSQTFSITTLASLTADAKVVISASYGNITKSEALTITTTPRLSLVSISPRTVQGGTPATGTVTLSSLSSGTSNVTLTSSAPTVASVPASVGILNGQAFANFSITTFSVSSSQAVTITATYLGVNRSASVTVVPFAVQKGLGTDDSLAESDARPPDFHLASLTVSETKGSLMRSARGKDFDQSTREGFSLGLPSEFAEESDSGSIRPMDGPIYSVPGPAKRHFIYSPEMNLLAESEVSSPRDRAILYEYIWFNGQPVAQVDGATVVHWTFTDHLGTPMTQTDAAGTVFWRVEYEPYGRVFAKRPTGLADQHQPLRLPGQEAEQFNLGLNGLTERSYNVFRWYRANWGRYTQSDPIGLKGGTNLFAYVNDRPTFFIDPFGLCCTNVDRTRELLLALSIAAQTQERNFFVQLCSGRLFRGNAGCGYNADGMVVALGDRLKCWRPTRVDAGPRTLFPDTFQYSRILPHSFVRLDPVDECECPTPTSIALDNYFGWPMLAPFVGGRRSPM